MFFRNLTLFRFPASAMAGLCSGDGDPNRFEHCRDAAGFLDVKNMAPCDEAAFYEDVDAPLLEALQACALKPVGPLELSSLGFIPPMGGDTTALTRRVGDCVWLAVGGEDKLLPAAVVNAELAKRMAAIERAEGRKPGGRARKRLKEDIVHELLPRALVRPSRCDCYLDLARGLLVVDTASRKAAEAVVSEVRHALGSFAALPLSAAVAPRAALTEWLDDTRLPDGLAHADSAILKDASERGASVRLTHQHLVSAEVTEHLGAGKQCTRLGLTFNDHLGFTLDEDLAIRGVRFLEGAIDQLESDDRDDLRAELDARFALMTGTFGQLFDTLLPALHINAAEG